VARCYSLGNQDQLGVMEKGKISVVIPFFNGKEYVEIMVQSILNQTYTDWELLMVDDGSTDGAESYVKRISSEDSRVRYIERKAKTLVKGACSARNVGLESAIGEYIVFLDSDDWIVPECLEHRVSFMENNPDIDFAVFPYYKYRDKNHYNGDVISGVNTNEDDIRNLIIRNLPFTVVSNIYRRDALLRGNLRWDENLASIQDADFNISCVLGGMRYKYCQEYSFDYYVRMQMNVGSISKRIITPKHLKSHLYYLSKYKDIFVGLNQRHLLKAYSLLIVSFMRLFANGTDVDFRNELNNIIKDSFDKDIVLRYKLTLLNYISFKQRRVSNLFNSILFPELPLAFRKSTEKRRKICEHLYQQSIGVIEEIEDIMMK